MSEHIIKFDDQKKLMMKIEDQQLYFDDDDEYKQIIWKLTEPGVVVIFDKTLEDSLDKRVLFFRDIVFENKQND